ncbi:MAG: hypothetical protein ACRDZS_12680, partial [Acidimicrobiales bacterium]
MLRDRGPAHRQQIRQRTHRLWPRHQQLEDGAPGWIAQRVERLASRGPPCCCEGHSRVLSARGSPAAVGEELVLVAG